VFNFGEDQKALASPII